MAKYYLVAGEASGDLHGSHLMEAIKTRDPEAEFRFYGGDKMQAQGGTLVKHYAEMAFMGFTEVVMNLGAIFKNLRNCKQDISQWEPDTVVLIDFPGFNLKIAQFAKESGIKTCYFISPKVWAWNQRRVIKIKKIVDLMLCILPFEIEFYKKWNYDAAHYIGNPLMDEIAGFKKNEDFSKTHGLEKPVIALLPGSRKQEIERLLPEMLRLENNFADFQFVIAGAPTFELRYYQEIAGNIPIKVVFSDTYNLLAVAHAAIVASGTATLETALFNVPQIVVYKGGAISIAIARMVVSIRFISLVNLIADKKIVTELIQDDFNTTRATQELLAIVDGAGRERMLADYNALAEQVGGPGASLKAAELVVKFVGN